MGRQLCGTSLRQHTLHRLCLITDRRASLRTGEEAVKSALGAGVRWIQYREKEKTRREIYSEALRLREMTQRFGALLIVNDHADIALAVDADGVHLGQDDLPLPEARKIMGDRIIGISTHSVKEAMDAAAGGADYIGFGPVFSTDTKDAGVPKGLRMLSEVKSHVNIPVVAIGGISVESLPEVLETGIDAVAVASGILRGDISKNVRSFMKIMREEI